MQLDWLCQSLCLHTTSAGTASSDARGKQHMVGCPAASELRASEAGDGWYHIPDLKLAGDGWYHVPDVELAALQATSEQAVQAPPLPELGQQALTR